MQSKTGTIEIPEKRFLTLSEAAVWLEYSPRHLRRMIAMGKFPMPNDDKKWSNLDVGIWAAWRGLRFAKEGEIPLEDDETGKRVKSKG